VNLPEDILSLRRRSNIKHWLYTPHRKLR